MRDGRVKGFILWGYDLFQCGIAVFVVPCMLLYYFWMVVRGYEDYDYTENGEVKTGWRKRGCG